MHRVGNLCAIRLAGDAESIYIFFSVGFNSALSGKNKYINFRIDRFAVSC